MRPFIGSLLGVSMLVPALAAATDGTQSGKPQAQDRPNVILITLDTTRADHVGVYAGLPEVTPHINAIARSGVRYDNALTPAPITLPAHATILTGLDPPEHGVRDNGRGSLPADIPTLATELAAAGYSTAAFVASRVLDHRFGLDRGFSHYDDIMAAELVGEYGYAERNATAVTNAAVAWLQDHDPTIPFFIWVHYYDPHAPYLPPDPWRQSSTRANYAGEIAFVDQEVARLIKATPGSSGQRLIAIVGDHGESLGEHGERSHGIFLYRQTLAVPLILAGAGIPKNTTVSSVVGLRQLAPTLLTLVGRPTAASGMAPTLPGAGLTVDEALPDRVYGESRMQVSVYGWAPLTSLTTDQFKLIDGPVPELFDLRTDPGETRNIIQSSPNDAAAMYQALASVQGGMSRRHAEPTVLDPELTEALEALGYLQGADSSGNRDGIDPRTGLRLLDQLERAKEAERRGAYAAAATMLKSLQKKNPSNLPVLTHLASSLLANGQTEQAVDTYEKALALNPESEFLWMGLGNAHLAAEQTDLAIAAYRKALEIDPRSATAWLRLAELSPDEDHEKLILEEAVKEGTASSSLLVKLAQIEAGDGHAQRADELLSRACDLTPDWAPIWMFRGDVALKRTQTTEAAAWYRRYLQLQPGDAAVLLKLGTTLLRLGDNAGARTALQQAIAAGGAGSTTQAARLALSSIEDGS